MTLYILRRVLYGLITLWLMSVVAFAAVYVLGNPVDLLVDPAASQQERQLAAEALGLDRSMVEQYVRFLGNALQLEFGKSYSMSMPVGDLLLDRLPATLELTFMAMVLSVIMGLPLGILAGLYPDNPLGRSILNGSILGFSLPTFWFGLLLVMVFSVQLGWIPSTGRGETVRVFGIQWALFTWDGVLHLLLPAVTLAISNTATLIRLVSSGLRETMLLDFIKFARARGLRERRVVMVHALGNILIPVVTVLGLDLAMLLTGSIVVETVFAYPGIGRLAVDAINFADRPVIVGYVLFVVSVFVLLNLVVDIVVAFADPRVGSRR